jgi:peptidyl-tRNA hydrolase
MYLVVRRGAVASLARAAELGGAAAVACTRAFAGEPTMAEWRPRPGKVCLRARSVAQWQEVLGEPHAIAGDPEGEAVVALPPRRRSARGPLLERLQAMSTALEPAPRRAACDDTRVALTCLLGPGLQMSSGKTVAQVAHAAVMAADTGTLEDWIAAGAPMRVLAPDEAGFAAAAGSRDRVACVQDAGLTEVAPGTITVVALGPSRAVDLPPALRAAP